MFWKKKQKVEKQVEVLKRFTVVWSLIDGTKRIDRGYEYRDEQQIIYRLLNHHFHGYPSPVILESGGTSEVILARSIASFEVREDKEQPEKGE